LAGAHLFCGFYLNELLWRLLPQHDSHPRIFDHYEETLSRLREAGAGCAETALRFFELALLREIGYGPLLEHDAESGEAIRPDRHYIYHREKGPVAAEPGVRAVSGACLLGLRDGRLSNAGELREAKRLMRCLIDPLLDGRPLKSRELFKSVRMPGILYRENVVEESSCSK
jgi:DNA repair protein RecO (recombination protein O)